MNGMPRPSHACCDQIFLDYWHNYVTHILMSMHLSCLALPCLCASCSLSCSIAQCPLQNFSIIVMHVCTGNGTDIHIRTIILDPVNYELEQLPECTTQTDRPENSTNSLVWGLLRLTPILEFQSYNNTLMRCTDVHKHEHMLYMCYIHHTAASQPQLVCT